MFIQRIQTFNQHVKKNNIICKVGNIVILTFIFNML